ncbi:MAG: DUF4982 domain-containing protein [Proteiniphilum sp.]|jgi:beta-galactosidase/beta-glucuronidase|nr:DUF4982 domain-containing protein [Proteiniphilum sp.]
MNRKVYISAILALTFITAGYAQVSFGKPEKLNKEWYFTLENADDRPVSEFNAPQWQKTDLPHDWSVKEPLSPTLASATGYLPGGIGWYGKNLSVPKEWEGEKLFLYFEGVYNRSEVFFNGHSLGKRPNGYISFMYDATPHVRYGEDNRITVRVDHSRSADSRWYTGSGIYRNVWVIRSGPVHIAQWGVYARPSVEKNRGILKVEVEIENESDTRSALTVESNLYDPSGTRVANSSGRVHVASGAKGKINLDLRVNRPLLWSVDTPALYTLETRVLDNGREIDRTSTTTGFRTFTFDPDKGFALNGRWMKMKGVCLHHDAGVLGAAVPREVWRRRLLALKETGCNAIRTSHNPQAPDLYELCDELGMLVLNEAFDEWEFPKRKWIKGWNVGKPLYEGSYDFFEEWGERDLADMVRRDRNHPSVFAWSIGNEVDYPNDPYSHPVLDGGKDTGFTQPVFGGYRKEAPDAMRLGGIAMRLARVVREHDPTRPVTAGLAGVAMSNRTEYPGVLDIAGYNYTESFYVSDHGEYPDRVIYGSETGHSMEAWKAVAENEHIFGQFLWTGIDYLGESGRWPSRGFYSGLLDFGGFIKPRGHFRQSLWSDKPMARTGTWPVTQQSAADALSQDAHPVWNYKEGQMIRTVCYTNAAQARLELNGQPAGETKPYDDRTGIIFWDIPFRPGTLEVIGMDRTGKETVRHAIQTSTHPYAIRVEESVAEISSDEGLACITLQVVDESGIPVMLSDDEITCTIHGPARLLGLESGNNHDMSDYTDNRHRVYLGRLLAYIQSTGESGHVKIDFTSPWLKGAEVEIRVGEKLH